jgi:MobA/MobL family
MVPAAIRQPFKFCPEEPPMPLNRVSVTLLTRKSGHSTIEHAAYIDRDQYRDERTGKLTADYANRGDKEWSEVWLPKDAPERFRNPETFWNELEKREDQQNKRDTALLARSWIFTIPHWEGQTPADRLLMTKDLLREYTRKGWACHAAIHTPDSDNPNPHIHLDQPMRYLTPDGFGLRRKVFEKDGEFAQIRDELKHWKDRWSEIGARHLERAGFPEEALRYRTGHLSRDEKLNDALDRGDKEHADRMEDRPKVHMGAAHHKDQKGEYTRKGDKNREIDDYNKALQEERKHAREQGREPPNDLRGTPREIWWAYNGTRTAEEFQKSIEARGLHLCRTNRQDEIRSAVDFAYSDGKFVPHYNNGEYVVVTEKGWAFRLTHRSTGDTQKQVAEVMKPLNDQPMFGLEETRQGLDQQRQERIADYLQKRQPKKVKELKYPAGLTGERREIWESFQTAGNATAFQKNLYARGMFVARATHDDALASKTQSWAAEREGRYSPVFKDGEYMIVTARGQAYQLSEKSTSVKADVAQQFMKQLDGKETYNLRQLRALIEEDRISNIPRWRGDSGRNKGRRYPGGLNRAAERSGRTMLGIAVVGANLFEGMVSPPLSPKQKLEGEIAQDKTKRDVEIARNGGMERD